MSSSLQSSAKKPAVAIFLHLYIEQSMTFVYRMLKGVEAEFTPIVLASEQRNVNLFPHAPILVPECSLIERLMHVVTWKATGWFRLYRNWRYYEKQIDKFKPGLIHAHFGPSALEILPLAKKKHIPLIAHFHGNDASRMLAWRQYRLALKDLFDYAVIICVSKIMREKLLALGARPNHTHVLYYGVPVNDVMPANREPLQEKFCRGATIEFVQVARFTEKKGHRYSIIAFNKFAKKVPNSRLTFIGDGLLLDAVKGLCVQLGIANKVRFCGAVASGKVPEYLANADIFVHHSITAKNGDQEGIPNALMEAMAQGLPVISTFHAGIPELVRDGEDGYLVEEKDVDTYADRMRRIIPVAHTMGRNAHAQVKAHFNLERQSQKLREIYREIINA